VEPVSVFMTALVGVVLLQKLAFVGVILWWVRRA